MKQRESNTREESDYEITFLLINNCKGDLKDCWFISCQFKYALNRLGSPNVTTDIEKGI